MRVVQSCRGPFWVHDLDQLGQQLEAQTWWDQHLQPTIDAVAAAHPNGIAIDLGANVGWFTTYFAEKFAGVLAVEAHPATYELLSLNMDQRPETRAVTVAFCCAAFDVPTRMRWARGDEIGWPYDPSNLGTTPNASSVGLIADLDGDVDARPVDSLLSRTTDVALIKVDVQGADLRALKGLRHTIARDRPTILFEYEQGASLWHGDTWLDYEAFFAARDYVVSHIHASDWLAVPKEQA